MNEKMCGIRLRGKVELEGMSEGREANQRMVKGMTKEDGRRKNTREGW